LPETALYQAQDFTNNTVILMFKVEKWILQDNFGPCSQVDN
jgi:hypothetical protein